MEKELEEWYKLHKFHFYAGSYETKDLANFLGITARTIQRWLTGKGKPNKEQLVKIGQYLSSQEAQK